MDNFREEVVVRRKSGMYNAMYYLSWLLIVISALIALTQLMTLSQAFAEGFGVGTIIQIVVMLLFAGAAFLLWRNKDELRAEYEYSFTNGDLDVAKVLNNTRRKYLTSLPLKNVEACGEVTHQSFQRYLTMKDVKKHNWFLNREAKLYYFYFTKSAVKHLIVLELSDEMVGLVKSRGYLNFGVWQN